MPRKAKEPTLTIAFFGEGEMSSRAVKTTLNDYLEDKPEVEFVLPLTRDHFTETLQIVGEYAVAAEIPWSGVTDAESSNSRVIKPYLKDATEVKEGVNITTLMVNALKRAEDAVLVVLWPNDEEDASEALSDICAKAAAAEIPVLEMTSAMSEIELDVTEAEVTGGDPEEGDPEEEEAEEAETSEEEEWEPYTEGELQLKEPAVLKEIAADFGWEVPPRTRTTTIIAKILELQEKELEAAELLDADGRLVEPDAEEVAPLTVLTFSIEELAGELSTSFAAVLSKQLAEVVEAVTDHFDTKLVEVSDLIKESIPAGGKAAPAPVEEEDEDDEPAPAPRRIRRPRR